jgi:soluble lytic murein transglycosylase-like protein
MSVASKAVLRWKELIPEAQAFAKKKTGVDVPTELVLAVIHAESGGDPKAESACHAYGLMQLMKLTALGLGITNRADPKANIRGGTLYLAKMLKMFGNTSFAVAAYNAGPGNVKKHKGIPPFRETKAYVKRVTTFMSVYKGA